MPRLKVEKWLSTNLGLLCLRKEFLLPLLPLLWFFSIKVPVASHLVYRSLVQAAQVDLDACGNDVSRVDPSEWDSVDFERPRDEQNALREMPEENDTLAAEPAS